MTVSISSLQSELLNLLNGSNDVNDNPLNGGAETSAEVSIEDVLESTPDENANSDLKGGDNIQGMLENILTGGNKKPTSDAAPEDNNTSESAIIENILLEDEKVDSEQNKLPEDAINEILIQGSGDEQPIEGGDKQKQQIEQFDVNDEEEGNAETDTNAQHNDSSESEHSDYSDNESSDYSDNEFVEEKHLKVD